MKQIQSYLVCLLWHLKNVSKPEFTQVLTSLPSEYIYTLYHKSDISLLHSEPCLEKWENKSDLCDSFFGFLKTAQNMGYLVEC